MKACISKLDQQLEDAQAVYNKQCRKVALYQREFREELLELAPDQLHRVLQKPLHTLFSYMSASFRLRTMDKEDNVKTAALITQLAYAWKDAVHVDTVFEERKGKSYFTVYLRAVQVSELK
ncbi:MAG: hypothetical protein ACAH17_01700 [Candidatus Paceibacterota bacterium]